MVSIAAFQAVDPGSIPGQRRSNFLFSVSFYLNIILITLIGLLMKRYDQGTGKYEAQLFLHINLINLINFEQKFLLLSSEWN